MKTIFRDELGFFTVSEVESMEYLSGVWHVVFLDRAEEYHETELIEVSL